MNSIKLYKRQAGRFVAAATVLFAMFVPALASAAQVTERSIALSSSSASATNVTYTVNFTAATGGVLAFVVDFCSDSPVLGQTCTPPTDFDASAAASTTSGFTSVTGSTSKVVVGGTINASDNVSVELTGINNPSTAGPLYARIVTFDTVAHANAYTSTTPGTGVVDNGGVAMSITSTIGVSGAVLENMTFCVAGAAITTAGCGGTLTAPTLNLGETVGTTKALDAAHVSTGDIYTQISTNAASGAIVSLKSGVTCGGMKRVEAASCDIAPALQTGITFGQAKFGVLAAADAATNTSLGATGAFQAVPASGYNASTYTLNWVSGNATGVASTYGDPFLDTNSLPANNKNMKLTFGASVSSSTPAGAYSADLSLIATGKF